MKSIKERAIEKYCTHCGARTEYNCSAEETPCYDIKNYIKIATEQKAIDDAYFADASKIVIDKAWQWMEDWVFENAPHEVFDELMSSREEYIKAMEG